MNFFAFAFIAAGFIFAGFIGGCVAAIVCLLFAIAP